MKTKEHVTNANVQQKIQRIQKVLKCKRDAKQLHSICKTDTEQRCKKNMHINQCTKHMHKKDA